VAAAVVARRWGIIGLTVLERLGFPWVPARSSVRRAGVFLAGFADLAVIETDLASNIRGFDGELSEKSGIFKT
jgi:hypothetical protein